MSDDAGQRPNAWRRGSLATNPYYRTAFRVAGVPREIADYATVAQLIGRTRRKVQRDASQHTIRGEEVSEADINNARLILTDPAQRAAEELLHHAEETPPLERVRRLARELAQAMSDAADQPLPVTNLGALAPWARSLALEYLAAAPAADPCLGAGELEIVPPFGTPEEE